MHASMCLYRAESQSSPLGPADHPVGKTPKAERPLLSSSGPALLLYVFFLFSAPRLPFFGIADVLQSMHRAFAEGPQAIEIMPEIFLRPMGGCDA